jgi:hypothetical protein
MKSQFISAVEEREKAYAAYLLLEKAQTICYIEAIDNTAQIVLRDSTRIWVNSMLSNIEKLLPNNFYRCNSSYIVNTEMVQEFWVSSQPMLVMNCGAILPITVLDMFHLKYVLGNKFSGNWTSLVHV